MIPLLLLFMFVASELQDLDIERYSNSVSSCRIPKDILATNYVFATFENYAWELQHNDRVPVCGSIYLLCGDGGSKFTCNPDGSFSPELPTTNCAQVLSPTVREDSNDQTCRTPPLAMYRVGYQFGEFFMEIYRTCYDKTGYAAQFSIHKLYSSDERAPRPAATFTLDGAMTVSESNAMRNDNIYERFKKILGNGQTYMAPGSYLFNRGHLTAPADFPFAHQQKATFKIRNVVPQYAEVNNGNWKAVESWVRRLVDQRNYYVLKVCTGALDVHHLENQQTHIWTPIYLLENKIPVPKWTYKIVSHLSGARYVVITYNDIFSTRRPDPETICNIMNCDDDLKRQGKGFTYCCNPDDFIRDNLPQLTGIC